MLTFVLGVTYGVTAHDLSSISQRSIKLPATLLRKRKSSTRTEIGHPCWFERLSKYDSPSPPSPHFGPCGPLAMRLTDRLVRSGFLKSILVAATILAATPAAATEITGKLVHVRDADTIEIATSRGRIAIRLNGVDAPELDERGGRAGRDWMRRAFGDQRLTCYLDGDRTYDRWVGVCWDREGHDLGASVIAAGHARDCPRFSGGRYTKFETSASRSIPSKPYCR